MKIANTLKNSIVKAYKGFKIVSGSLDGTVSSNAAAVDDSEQIPFDCEVFPRHLFIEQANEINEIILFFNRLKIL